MICAGLILLSGCGSAEAPVAGKAEIGTALIQRRQLPDTRGLPGLGQLRGLSSTLNLNLAGTEAAMLIGPQSWNSGDLILQPESGGSAIAVYAFRAEGRTQSGLALEVSELGPSGFWVALADFGAGRWDIRGPFTQSLGLPMAGADYINADGEAYAALIAYGDAVTVDQATLVVTGADAQNDWPAGNKPLRTAWLKSWYLPLPLLGGADGVYQGSAERMMADEVFERLNTFRAENGLDPLLREEHLDAQSCAHCRDMASRLYFEHDSPEGMDPGERLDAMDPPFWLLWAENIAVGYQSPEDVTTGWINSDGHRMNMLLEDADYVGIGVWRNYFGTLYWAHNFGSFDSDPAAHDWIEPGEEQP